MTLILVDWLVRGLHFTLAHVIVVTLPMSLSPSKTVTATPFASAGAWDLAQPARQTGGRAGGVAERHLGGR